MTKDYPQTWGLLMRLDGVSTRRNAIREAINSQFFPFAPRPTPLALSHSIPRQGNR